MAAKGNSDPHLGAKLKNKLGNGVKGKGGGGVEGETPKKRLDKKSRSGGSGNAGGDFRKGGKC